MSVMGTEIGNQRTWLKEEDNEEKIAKIRRIPIKRNNSDGHFREHVSDGIFWVQKICEVFQTHFTFMRPTSQYLVYSRFLAFMALIPHLTNNKNKGALSILLWRCFSLWLILAS